MHVRLFRFWFSMAEFTLYNMMFKEGSTVEVCRKDDGPLGSWFSARIISYNGKCYSVKYENLSDCDGKNVIEEVSPEVVRPLPPATRVKKRLEFGEIVEAYDCHAWKTGKIISFLPSNFFVVKLLESLRERTCHFSCLRQRISWKGCKWVHMPQDSEGHRYLAKDIKDPSNVRVSLKKLVSVRGSGELMSEKKTRKNVRNNQPVPVHTTALKRKADCLSLSAFNEDVFKAEPASQKKRAHQKFGYQDAMGASSDQRLEKVDTFPFPKRNVGEECVGTYSFKDRVDQSSEEAESIHCSIGSNCSSYTSNAMLFSDEKCRSRPLGTSLVDDAESICECPKRRSVNFSSRKEVATKIHKLELYAYRSALRAFYASGPLSWEKEALLSNLRFELNISNDEHLAELKCLHSAEAL